MTAVLAHQPGLIEHLQDASDQVRWCTPSLLPGLPLDPAHDLSVSYSPAGSMLEHSGWFAEAEARVAQRQGTARAFLVTAGSTVANHVVLRALARRAHPGVVLVDRQAHHSVIRGLNMFGLDWRYIDAGPWHDRFECPGVLRPRDVFTAVRKAGSVSAIVLVSPTYGGEIADLAGMRSVVDQLAPDAVLHVDEAWGSHLAFHPDLNPWRAAQYADVVTQSTHKAAGSLQPGAVLLWNETSPIGFDLLDAAYLDLMSTSASFLIAASIDHGYRVLEDRGQQLLDVSIRHVQRLEDELSRIQGAELLTPGPGAVAVDPTKCTLALPPESPSGYEVRDRLLGEGIVLEKATPSTVTFLATYGLTGANVDHTIDAVCRAVATPSADGRRRPSVTNPFECADARPLVRPADVQRAGAASIEVVPTAQAVGRVAAESIEAYPPGVAVIAEGFRVTTGALDWLRTVQQAGGSILGGDPALETMRVLR